MATVDELFAQQKSYADTSVAASDAFVSNLYSIAVAPDFVIAGIPEPGYVTRFTVFGGGITRPTAPTITAPTGTLPALTPATIAPISEEPVPQFTVSPPAVNIPVPPSSVLPSAPAQPVVSPVDIPQKPAITLPAVPTIQALALPSPPSLGDLPAFDGVLPTDDLVIPTANFAFAEQAYASALLDAAKAKLLNDIENGGYGIEPADEAPLWERQRARANEQASAEVEQIERASAARGFEFPPGDILVEVDRARARATVVISQANADIAFKRADMYVENRRFVLGEARQIETVLIQYHGSVMERALNVQRALLEFAVANWNMVRERHQQRLNAYEAYARTFEIRLRAVLARLEAYRTEMEGKRIESEIQRQQVELYRAQLDAVNTLVAIFRVEMDAAKIRSDIERDKLVAYQASIAAFREVVGAKVAEFQMFDAQIRGELSKVQVYDSQSQAYQRQVEAAKVRSDIRIGNLNASIAIARDQKETFLAQLRAYETDLEAKLKTINATISKYQADVSMYNVDVGQLRDAYRLNAELASLEQNERLKTADIAMKRAELQLSAFVQSRNLSINASRAAIETYGQRVSQAIGAMNLVGSKAE